MKRMTQYLIVTVTLILATSTASKATTLYKCTDAAGKTAYQGTPCKADDYQEERTIKASSQPVRNTSGTEDSVRTISTPAPTNEPVQASSVTPNNPPKAEQRTRTDEYVRCTHRTGGTYIVKAISGCRPYAMDSGNPVDSISACQEARAALEAARTDRNRTLTSTRSAEAYFAETGCPEK